MIKRQYLSHFPTLCCALCCLLFLSACTLISTQPEREPSKLTWTERANTLSEISRWTLSGRFGAKNSSDSWSGSINWHQDQSRYTINISGPLSTGSVEISGDDGVSELFISDEESYGASDPEELLELHTGLRLPMNNLRYWLVGLPSPPKQNDDDSEIEIQDLMEFDDFGRLKKLSQQGWVVSFRRYTFVDDVELPNKIFLVNHEFDVRLIIQRWNILT